MRFVSRLVHRGETEVERFQLWLLPISPSDISSWSLDGRCTSATLDFKSQSPTHWSAPVTPLTALASAQVPLPCIGFGLWGLCSRLLGFPFSPIGLRWASSVCHSPSWSSQRPALPVPHPRAMDGFDWPLAIHPLATQPLPFQRCSWRAACGFLRLAFSSFLLVINFDKFSAGSIRI